jgi:hypothetical protein
MRPKGALLLVIIISLLSLLLLLKCYLSILSDAWQGTGVYNVHRADMAMYGVSTSTYCLMHLSGTAQQRLPHSTCPQRLSADAADASSTE